MMSTASDPGAYYQRRADAWAACLDRVDTDWERREIRAHVADFETLARQAREQATSEGEQP